MIPLSLARTKTSLLSPVRLFLLLCAFSGALSGFSLADTLYENWQFRFATESRTMENVDVVKVEPSTGNVFIAGTVRKDAPKQYVAKVNGTTGAEIWRQIFPETAGDYAAVQLLVLPDGNVATSAGGANITTRKLNGQTGETIWKQEKPNPVIPTSRCRDIKLGPTGDVYVLAEEDYDYYFDTGDNYHHLYAIVVLRYNGSTGTSVWQGKFAGQSQNSEATNEACALAIDTNGNAYVSGSTTANSTKRLTYCLQKYDGQNGSLVWDYRGDESTYSRGTGVLLAGDGGLLVLSTRSGSRRLAKYAPSGAILWEVVTPSNHIPTSSLNESFVLDGAGDAYVLDQDIQPESGLTGPTHLVKHAGNSGAEIWRTEITGTRQVWQVALDSSGSLVTAGFEYRPEDYNDAGLMVSKFASSTGVQSAQFRFRSDTRPSDNLATEPLALHGQNIFLGGATAFSYSSDYIVDGLLVKLAPTSFPISGPQDLDIASEYPYKSGVDWTFKVRQDGVGAPGSVTIKVQYAKAFDQPLKWQDLPNSTLTNIGGRYYSVTTTSVPDGAIKFRVVTVVQGGQTFTSEPTGTYAIEKGTTQPPEPAGAETSITVSSAADPTGATTHRGDVLNYEVSYRVTGSTAATNLLVAAYVPANTKLVKMDKGAKIFQLPNGNGAEISWKIAKANPSDVASKLRFSLQVLEPTKKQVAAGAQINEIGENLSSVSYAQAGQLYVSSPEPVTSTIINPLQIEAVRLGGSVETYRPGDTVRMFFKITDKTSYVARAAKLSVHPAANLVILDAGSGPQIVDSSKQPIGYPLDGVTGKQVRVVPGFKTNPALEDKLDAGQTAFFAYGSLKPLDTRYALVTFRIPYDFPVAQELVINFGGAKFSVLSPAGYTVEATAPPVTINLQPAEAGALKPALTMSMTQIGAGPDPDDDQATDRVAVNAVGLGVTGVLPKRLSNEITYRVTYTNVGTAPAGFIRAFVPLPEGTTYKARSAKVLQAAQDDLEISDPVAITGGLAFQLPYLGKNYPAGADSGKTLEFTVKVKPKTAIGTEIEQQGGFLFSRESFQPAILNKSLFARVVQAINMQYTLHTSAPELSTSTNTVYHSVLFANSGGVQETGVRVKYKIPAGLKFQSAYLTDSLKSNTALPLKKGQLITKPTVGGTGDVIFDIGTVAPRSGGVAKIVLASNTAATSNSAGSNSRYRLESTVEASGDHSQEGLASPGVRAVAKAPVEPGSPAYLASLLQPFETAQATQLFVMLVGPAAAHPGDEITYKVIWGNHVNRPAGVGSVVIPIPEGTEYVSSTNTQKVGDDANDEALYRQANDPVAGQPERVVYIGALSSNALKLGTITLRVKAGASTKITLKDVRIGFDMAGIRYAVPLNTTILPAGADAASPQNQALIYSTNIGQAAGASRGSVQNPLVPILDSIKQTSGSSFNATIANASYFNMINGSVAVPFGAGRMVAAGGGNLVAAGGGNMVAAGGGNLVAAGGGNLINFTTPAGASLNGSDLIKQIPSLVAAGGGNLVAAGGGNLVQLPSLIGQDGGSLIGMDGATLIGMDGASLGKFGIGASGYSFNPASGAAISWTSATLVAAGGGNLVAAGGGNLVAAGGGNFVPKTATLIGQDGATLLSPGGAGLAIKPGAYLIGQDGATLIGQDGATIISRDSAGIISRDSAGIISRDSAGFTATGGGNLISGGSGLR